MDHVQPLSGMTSATPRTATLPLRMDWLDHARGIGIILVVIGHALGGLMEAGILDHRIGLRYTFFGIYTFHMPLFFILSGLLVQTRIERDKRKFGISLFSRIVWPYFLWSYIQFSCIYLMASHVNHPPNSYWPRVVELLWHTVSQFHFLYSLFLLHMLAILIVPRAGALAFLFFGLMLKPLATFVPLPEVIRIMAYQAPYYAIGLFLGLKGVRELIIDRSALVRGLGLPLIAIAIIVITCFGAEIYQTKYSIATASSGQMSATSWHMAATAAALAGTAAIIGIATLTPARLSKALGWLGQRSMSIFILHILFVAGLRVVLVRLVPDIDLYILLLAQISVGLIGPLLLDALFLRLGWSRWLGLA